MGDDTPSVGVGACSAGDERSEAIGDGSLGGEEGGKTGDLDGDGVGTGLTASCFSSTCTGEGSRDGGCGEPTSESGDAGRNNGSSQVSAG